MRFWYMITCPGTNWSPAAARLAADGARDFPWLEGAYLSQKLGVGAVVETTDGFVLTLRRSKGVAEGQGRMDAPGGHPEPKVSERGKKLFGCVFFQLSVGSEPLCGDDPSRGKMGAAFIGGGIIPGLYSGSIPLH